MEHRFPKYATLCDAGGTEKSSGSQNKELVLGSEWQPTCTFDDDVWGCREGEVLSDDFREPDSKFSKINFTPSPKLG
jgi:hypothetical protein